MTFGTRIANLRKAKNLTQEALAQQLGVTNQAVSKWESDQCYPDITLLPRLADVFSTTVDALFGRETPQPESLPWPDDGVLRVLVYAGHQHIANAPANRDIHFCYEGPALNIHSQLSVECQDVAGSVSAGGDVTCGDVQGDVSAGGDATCGDVQGDVSAEGDATCGNVAGPVSAGGDVTCDGVQGNVSAGGDVTCDDVEGNVNAGGDVTCDDVGGSVSCGGDLSCDSVGTTPPDEGPTMIWKFKKR